MKRLSLLEFMDKFPPFLVVAFARQIHGRSLSEISQITGISMRSLSRISGMDSWESVRVGVAERLLECCGVDLFNLEEARRLLRASESTHPEFAALPPAHRIKVFRVFERMAERLANPQRVE